MRTSLRRSILGMTIPIMLLLSLALAIAGFQIYHNDMIERYRNYAGDAINFLARRADGDDLEACIRTKTKSAAYEALQSVADDLKETYDLEYIYIVVPLRAEPPDNMMDVMAAVTAYELAEEADQLTDLGNLTGDAYPADAAAQYLARMDNDPTVTYFRNDTLFGDVYTAIRPLLNSVGEPVAVLCADIRTEEISVAALRYLVSAGVFALVFSLLFLALLNFWFDRRIVAPINRLVKAAAGFEERCRQRADVSALVMDDPDIQTGDEIEALSRSVVSMVQDMRSYAQTLVDKENEISRIDWMAHMDALTKVNNRYSYLEMQRLLKEENYRNYGVVMVDLDHLKAVNDAYGHERGDEYIVGTCRTVSGVFRHSPVYRIGGDEFVVILQGSDYREREKLCAELKQRFRFSGSDQRRVPWQRYSAAVGMSVYEEGDTVDAVFERADRAMYEDKKQRR